jgi:hypothetical protein
MADQETYSIQYFYKIWRLTKEGDLVCEDAQKIAKTDMLWHRSHTCRPVAVGQSTIDKPAHSGLDLYLSRDFYEHRKL